MSKKLLRFFSMLIVFSMIINMLPVSAFATEGESNDLTPLQSVEQEEITEDVYILEEIVENRTEYSKKFVLSNGLHMAAVYGEAVHYEEDGQWKEIDNTLKSSGVGENAIYTNTAGDWDVSFPQQLSENRSVSVTKNGYTLRFTITGEVHTTPGSGLVTASENLSIVESNFELQKAEAAPAEIQKIDLTEMRANAEHPEIIPESSIPV